jgi:hypothetical protein
MKKTVFIVGGVLALGAIAYLFLKNKKKQEAILGGAGSATSSPTTASGGTTSGTTSGATSSPTNAQTPPPLSTGGIVTSTTVALTAQEQQALDRARTIESEIKNHYKNIQRQTLQVTSLWTIRSRTSYLNSLISNLKKELLNLGYEYKGGIDGFLVKL